MKGTGHGGPQGFVLFKYGQAAQAACTVMNGVECVLSLTSHMRACRLSTDPSGVAATAESAPGPLGVGAKREPR
jgi:hypothetical protein